MKKVKLESQLVSAKAQAAKGAKKVNIPTVPVEWMGMGSWRLPSGQALAEFALQAGFLAPLMLGTGSAFSSGAVSKRKGKPLADLNAAPVPGRVRVSR